MAATHTKILAPQEKKRHKRKCIRERKCRRRNEKCEEEARNAPMEKKQRAREREAEKKMQGLGCKGAEKLKVSIKSKLLFEEKDCKKMYS